MGEKVEIEIVFPALMEYVPAIREFVRESLYTKNYTEKEAYRTEIMVDELISNSVIYGSDNAKDKVKLGLAFDEEKFECLVEDYGANKAHKERLVDIYNRLDEQQNIEEIHKGLSLVKLISDDITLDITKSGETEIRVVKYKRDEACDEL